MKTIQRKSEMWPTLRLVANPDVNASGEIWPSLTVFVNSEIGTGDTFVEHLPC